MEITGVKISLVHNDEKLKAYVSVMFDDCFVIHDLKVIQGESGLFVAMPSKRRKDGGFKDIAHPIDQRTRELVEREVLAAYSKETLPALTDP